MSPAQTVPTNALVERGAVLVQDFLANERIIEQLGVTGLLFGLVSKSSTPNR